MGSRWCPSVRQTGTPPVDDKGTVYLISQSLGVGGGGC